MIRKAINQSSSAKIIVTGCSAQSCSNDLKHIEGINFILGNKEKNSILKYLKMPEDNYPVIDINPIKHLKRYDTLSKKYLGLHTRSLIKIQDGCNNFCSYCKIPYVRGPQRSREPEDILKEICVLEEKGIKEIVLLGINLGTYGHDFENKILNLAKLIRMIENNCRKIERIRLSSIEINHIDEELINIFKTSGKMCPHLHIPLQNGSDRILQLMNRPYDTTFFSDNISKIRTYIPKLSITTDVMVGFPGEDDQSFNETYHFIKRINFSKLHVFPYSDREKCLSSLLLNKIDDLVKKDRMNQLLKLSKELHFNFMKSNLYGIRELLIETLKTNKRGKIDAYGITDNYIRVKINDFHGEKGDLLNGRLFEIDKDYMLAKILH